MWARLRPQISIHVAECEDLSDGRPQAADVLATVKQDQRDKTVLDQEEIDFPKADSPEIRGRGSPHYSTADCGTTV